MVRRVLTAPLYGLVLGVLPAIGLVQLVVGFVVSHAGMPPPTMPIRWSRWLPNLCRRLVGRWSGVPVPVPYHPLPPPPKPDADGMYREGNELYAKPWVSEFNRQWEWIMQDPATYRDIGWAALNPVLGAIPALVPAAFIGFGAATPWLGWAGDGAPAVGAAMIVAGLVAGPIVMRWLDWWTRVLLAPATHEGRTRTWAWIVARLVAAFRLAASIGSSIAGLGLAALHLLAIVPGFLLWWPETTLTSRRRVQQRRQVIERWTGVLILEPYRPEPLPPSPGPDGTYRLRRKLFTSIYHSAEDLRRAERRRWTLRDPASWRDMAWLWLSPILAAVSAVVPLMLILGGFVWLVWAWTWAQLVRAFVDYDSGFPWHALADVLPGLDAVPVGFAPLIGLAAAALGLLIAPWALRAYALSSKLLLGPTKAARLVRRVDRLTETRAEASDARAAELRRIERDLHDGAQAQWVAMGMRLGVVEQLIDDDPEAAKKLVALAQESSVSALEELRELVRGIHPPVLAERGLGDALRALGIDSPLDVDVAVDVPGRIEAPVEACLYFAAKELLTNVAKHAGATKVHINLRHSDGMLRMDVTDNGRGGADPSRGTGLRGVQRRIATFDGTLTLRSPRGGPTSVILEIPCALSLPRISTSSETA